MTVEIDRKELKAQARQAMGLTTPRFWVIALVFYALTVGVSYLVNAIPFLSEETTSVNVVGLFANIFFFLYRAVVVFGFTLWALWTIRRLCPGLGALTQGFSVAGRVIILDILTQLRVFGFAFASALCLLLPLAFLVEFTATVYGVMVAIVFIIIWAIMLRYALAPFLLADHPDEGPSAALRHSVQLMRGWKLELFKLEFSFFGWGLLYTVLSAIPIMILLWYNGFFQLLVSLPASAFSYLPSAYQLWISGSIFQTQSLPAEFPLLFDVFELYYNTMDNLWIVPLSELVALPVFIWMAPYRMVSKAGFYQARLQLQTENAPTV